MTDETMLQTDRLFLRNYRPEDWKALHVYASDPDFSKYELWGPNSVEDSKNFMADMIELAQATPRYRHEFAVCLKSTGDVIGGCGIRRETELSAVANLGWSINPLFQNQGFATEAARALIEFGFLSLKLKVIYATCDRRNGASFRVMEKLGMTKVGLIKGTREVKGHVRDTLRYEIVER